MKLTMVICLSALALAAEGVPAAKPAAKGVPAPQGLTIPVDAVAMGAGTFRYTSAEGKIWIYYQTPFGVVRGEERVTPQSELERKIADVKVTEDGDTVRFERPTPFGVMRWQRKKTELNEMERAAWDKQQAQPAQPAQQD